MQVGSTYQGYPKTCIKGMQQIVLSPDIFISQFIWPNDIYLNDLKTMKVVKMPPDLKQTNQAWIFGIVLSDKCILLSSTS